MSSTTTIATASRQHSFRLSPVSSSRIQLKQIPYPHQRQAAHSGERGLGSLHEMSSAAYYGQRSMGYEAGPPDPEPYGYSAPVTRSLANGRGAQTWSEDYQSYSQPQVAQRQQYQPPQQQQVLAQTRQAAPPASYAVSRQSTRPTTPTSTHSSHILSGVSANADAQSMVMHSLQIPARISSKSGNLADFSAQLTCLFWFESPKVLEVAEATRGVPEDRPPPLLSAHALPTEPFRKWVSSVLSTTQVTQNVILLALLFVYRLKMTNPSVRGRPGSEYRLLTVALMLGNKFLDDNTYTNKTWAEVSGITVQDIHVMEVEFLSNMRYALLASSEQWEEWLDKLASYFIFCERIASPSAAARMVPSPTLVIPSPTAGKGLSPVVSPTAYQSAQHASATTNGARLYSPPAVVNPTPAAHPDSIGSDGPLAYRPDLVGTSSRKRSWDEQSVEPPAKRAYRAPPQAAPKPAPDARRLPVPSLSLNTNYQGPVTQAPYSTTGYAMQQAASYAVSLPPLEPGTRAMSTVYAPPATSSWAPASSMTSGGPTHQNLHPSTLATPTNQYPPPAQYPTTTNATYGTPTKRLSPINTLTPAAAYSGSSPLHEYGQNSGFHTPISHSPSIYLQQRNSPYKPIRHVRTLLNPPPPSSLQNYQLPAIPPSQMHYQPIGRRNDQRTGIVPEYRLHDNYGSSIYSGNSRHAGMAPGHGLSTQQSQHRYMNQGTR